MGLFTKKRKAEGEPTRLFYACDIHGSEPTYRKFLNAAKFYEVDALVFGGDLMGKLLVPIVRDAGGVWRAGLHGQKHVLASPEELVASSSWVRPCPRAGSIARSPGATR